MSIARPLGSYIVFLAFILSYIHQERNKEASFYVDENMRTLWNEA